MPDTKNAYVLSSFELANTKTGYLPGAVIENMPLNQFNDLQLIGVVREATADEVKGDQAADAADESPADDA